MTDIVERMNAELPPFVGRLGGHMLAFDLDVHECRFRWTIGNDFCHSGDVVQGGFVTAMLDATMSHACFGIGDVSGLATLEIKVSFLDVSRAGGFESVGRVVKATHRTAFLSGELYDASGKITATASATAKLSRQG